MPGIIFVIADGYDPQTVISTLAGFGIVAHPFKGLKRHFRVPDMEVEAFPLLGDPYIEVVEPDDLPIKAASATQSLTVDLGFTTGNWGLVRILSRDSLYDKNRFALPATFELEWHRTGLGVDVFVFDTGIEADHVEFGNRASEYFNAVAGAGDAEDDNGHGTATASLAAGGTIGAARDSEIFAFKCLNSAGAGTNTDFIEVAGEALNLYADRAVLNYPCVINISIVGYSSAIDSALADLINAGMIVCAAVGNDGADLDSITVRPAELADVIQVAASDAEDQPFDTDAESRTAHGSEVHIIAPGHRIYNAVIGGTYAVFTGTSMATGIVTGVVACMMQGYARLTSRSQVQSLVSEFVSRMSLNKLNLYSPFDDLPNRLLYLDPSDTPETLIGFQTLCIPESGVHSDNIARDVGLSFPETIHSSTIQQTPVFSWPRAAGLAGQGAAVISS
jgi:subtilisin family serine protease